MSVEEKIQQFIGFQAFQICSLQLALEHAQARIKELEAPGASQQTKLNGQGVEGRAS